MSALLSPTLSPWDIALNPISHLSTAKVSSTSCRAIPLRRAPLEDCFPWVSRNRFSVNAPCYSFAIDLVVEGGEMFYRVLGEGFQVLVPTVGQSSDDKSNGCGPNAAFPCPNSAPAHGRLEVLGTTSILSGTGKYHGLWPVSTNQQSAGTVQGGRGGQRLWYLCTCVWRQDQPRCRQRLKSAVWPRLIDKNEASVQTLLFWRSYPPHLVFIHLLLLTTYLCKGHGRQC